MSEDNKCVTIAKAEEGLVHEHDGDHLVDVNDYGEVEVMRIRQSNFILRKLRAAETWMDRKLHVEGMGVERIPEDKRKAPHVVNVFIPSIHV
jgi:hypothetical protein